MITFQIDELTPCLKEVASGEIYDTEVVRIKRKSFLSKFNSRTGWYVNWSKFPEGTEIYALVLKGTMDIQGMIAVQYDDEAKAVYIHWACTSPDNNVWQYGKKRFTGVGGHLFAIASDLSVRKGFDGFVYAEAMDEELLNYYMNEYGALRLPPLHNPYRFMLSDEMTAKIGKCMIMNGQMKLSKEQIALDYIQRVNPSEKQPSLSFDLRRYAKYVKDNGLQAKEVTPEIMQMFSVEKRSAQR